MIASEHTPPRSAGGCPFRSRSLDGDLDAARSVGDAPADALCARLLRAGDVERADDALGRLFARKTGKHSAMVAMPRPLVAFLEEHGLPSWADRARIAAAQRFAERHCVAIAVSLFCAALPAAFTGAKGVGVLAATRRLHDDLDRRVNETGRFVFDVLMPHGFDGGNAVLSAQCVRLMHAAVRSRVATGAGREVPINQEDLLGTLLCFSVVVLDSLEKLGVEVSSADAEDYFHLWRVVGSLVGIEARRLPKSLRDARVAQARIGARQVRAGSTGSELAAVLQRGIERHLPARGFGVLAPSVMRYLLGDGVAASLRIDGGLRASDVAVRLPSWSRALAGAGGLLFGHALPHLNRKALERIMAHKLTGRPPSFHRPFQILHAVASASGRTRW